MRIDEALPIRRRTLNSVIDEYVGWRERDNRLGKEANRGRAIKFTQDGMLRQVQRERWPRPFGQIGGLNKLIPDTA
jgi:hypothetical protein